METYINESQLAATLGLSEKTLRKWRWEGKGPHFVKLGRRVVYRPADVTAYVASQIRTSTSHNGEAPAHALS